MRVRARELLTSASASLSSAGLFLVSSALTLAYESLSILSTSSSTAALRTSEMPNWGSKELMPMSDMESWRM